MSKYHAVKYISADGERFDSRKEYYRYCELKLMEKAGAIQNLERQKEFVLIPSQRDENRKVIERPLKYVADFVYMENGEKVVEDVKGMKTKEYIIKRKLMLYLYGLKIRET